ncbi:MAG: hypothetical protein ACREXX_14060 [Gammaproteobacteria bacterium]
MKPEILSFYADEILWQLVVEGIISPGLNSSNASLPWFHITSYGTKVLSSPEPEPRDPDSYLMHVRARLENADPTVMAYLSESLSAFRRGLPVSAMVMLGIAAERVFLILANSIHDALSDAKEKVVLRRLLDRFPMKPKLDWIHRKLQEVQQQGRAGFPDNAVIAVTPIYDLLRVQRNELGHPRQIPPTVSREDAFVNLQIFPRYFETMEKIRTFAAREPL